MKISFVVFTIFLLSVLSLSAQQGQGTVSGIIIEKTSNKPLEFANVIIRSTSDSSKFQGTVTGTKGEFSFDKLTFGDYKVVYSFIGFDKVETPVFVLNPKKSKLNLGKLYISESTASLGEVSVTAQRSTFVNSIDRKTFNVGQDVMSKTGSVSELLQNVPSVQVDIDGNVSLRGAGNVMFLINGKPSALMGTNYAAVLQQMPANSIEKIEIITNPSAKYKPDGTSGIINIVLKKDKSLGLNGTGSLNLGNDNRYNGNLSVNYNPGKINIFASYSVRQDDRLRYTDDYSKHFISNTDTIKYIHVISTDHSRPLSQILGQVLTIKSIQRTQLVLPAVTIIVVLPAMPSVATYGRLPICQPQKILTVHASTRNMKRILNYQLIIFILLEKKVTNSLSIILLPFRRNRKITITLTLIAYLLSHHHMIILLSNRVEMSRSFQWNM